ncbi:hypothetical protein [Streptomyces sp. NPDC002990]
MVLVAADVLGAPGWLSPMASDLRAAERFYGAVLANEWGARQQVTVRDPEGACSPSTSRPTATPDGH